MKITKRQLRRIIKEEKAKLLSEVNPDGTISDDEDNERDLLMAEVEEQMEELVRFIQMEAESWNNMIKRIDRPVVQIMSLGGGRALFHLYSNQFVFKSHAV